MTKTYRPGSVGALLDEYERAISDLEQTILNISNKDLIKIADHATWDTNCRSVQTILSHVVSAGFGYAIYIRQLTGHTINFPEDKFHLTINDYKQDLHAMFIFTADTFRDIQDDQLREFNHSKKIITSWGRVYDIEQITEHAIVHVLRHRRQIEKFKILLNVEE